MVKLIFVFNTLVSVPRKGFRCKVEPLKEDKIFLDIGCFDSYVMQIYPSNVEIKRMTPPRKKYLSFLNSTFASAELENIYQHYISERRKNVVLFVLLIYLTYNLVYISTAAIDFVNDKTSRARNRLIIIGCGLFFTNICLIVYVNYRKTQTFCYKYLCIFIWFVVYLQVLLDLIVSHKDNEISSSSGIMIYMFFIYKTYSIVPFRLYKCMALSLLVTLSHVAVVGIKKGFFKSCYLEVF